MKKGLSIGACVLISLALVLFGVLYGTAAGFADDRQHATELLTGENGVVDMLSYRAADGMNLAVVARRHLPENDADVAAMESAAGNLRDGRVSLTLRKQEDKRLDAAVQLVAEKLKQSSSFSASVRDKNYLDMLMTDMQDLSHSAVISTYNTAAREFNQQLEQPFIGSIAKLLGVKPCETF